MLISITPNGGLAPRLDPRMLPDSGAQVALNCRISDGKLEPYRGTADVAALSKAGTKVSMFRAGWDRPDDTAFWLHWTTDTDVVRSPVAGVTQERVYYTDGNGLRVTDASLWSAGGGTEYPTQSRTVGVPVPPGKPGVVVSGTPGAGEQPVERYFVYTLVNAWGEEGPPSEISDVASASSSQTITLSNLLTPTSDWTFTAKRIYMTDGTGTSQNFYQVLEIAAAAETATFPASTSAGSIGGLPTGSTIGQPLSTGFFDPPPDDLHGLVLMPGNFMAGISGNYVCFSAPGYPYAWPADYQVHIAEGPVALQVIGNTLVVATKSVPQTLSGVDPSQLQQQPIEENRAIVSKRSMCKMGAAVGYATASCFVRVDTTGIQDITGTFFNEKNWDAFNPSSMQAVFWNNQVVIAYDNGTPGLLILSQDKDPVQVAIAATAMYVDPQRKNLYLCVGGTCVRFNDPGADLLTLLWCSKIFRSPKPANLSIAQFYGSPNFTLRLYADGQLRATRTIADEKVHRLPDGYLAEEHWFELEGTGEVAVAMLASSFAELSQV